MERLDFASVMAVLRRNIPDKNFENQTDFLHLLFIDVNMRPQYEMEFDQGQVCRWINELARPSPNIISFYREKENQWKLLRRIKERRLPLMPDSAMATQDQFLDVMLKYRCRILFTIRSRYENHISLEVGELNPDTLVELAGKFFRKQRESRTRLDRLSN